MVDIEKIICTGIQRNASDIHIVKGMKPIFRVNKDLQPFEESDILTFEDVEVIYKYFIKDNKALDEEFIKKRKLDMNYEFMDSRLRVNISNSMDSHVFTIRIIKKELPDFDELELPRILKKIALLPQGLILVTGKSNSGKSTTLNALVNEISKTENKKILMLESPIEYMHESKKSLIISDLNRVNKVEALPAASEAVEALVALGYTKGEASLAVSRLDGDLTSSELITQALKSLARR